MPARLYLLISSALPALDRECEHLLVEEEGDHAPPEMTDELFGTTHSCATTLVSNYDDDGALRVAVEEWWHGIAGVRPLLELLTTDLSCMSEDQKDSVAELRPESWSIRTPLVLYRSGSGEARAEARRFVVESALAIH
jgi:hypothetical protein